MSEAERPFTGPPNWKGRPHQPDVTYNGVTWEWHDWERRWEQKVIAPTADEWADMLQKVVEATIVGFDKLDDRLDRIETKINHIRASQDPETHRWRAE